MSRHQLSPLNPAYEVAVGWDRPLRTFFAHVIDTSADEADDGRTVLWIRTDAGAVPDPAMDVQAVAPYAVIPAELEQTLRGDWAASVQQYR